MSNLHWQNFNMYRLAKSKDVKVEDRHKLKTTYDPKQPYNMEYNGVKATFPPEHELNNHGLIENEAEDHFFNGYNYDPVKMDLDQKKKHGWHTKFQDLVDKIHDSEILPSKTLHQIYKDSPIYYDMSDFGTILHLASGSNVNQNSQISRLLHDVMMYKLTMPITKHLHKEANPEHKELDEKLYDKLINGQTIGPVNFGSRDMYDENIGNFNPFILNDPHNDMNHLLPHILKNENEHSTMHHIINNAPIYSAPKEFHTRHLMNQIQEPEDLFHLPKNLLLSHYLSKNIHFPTEGMAPTFRDLSTEDFDNEYIVKAAQNLEEQLQKKQRLALTDDPNRYALTAPKEQSLVKFLEGKYKHDPKHLFENVHPDHKAIIDDADIEDLDDHARKFKHPVKKLSDYVLENENGVSSRFPRLHHLINTTTKILPTPPSLVNNYTLYHKVNAPYPMANSSNPTLDVEHLNSSPLRENINYDINKVKDFIPLHNLHVDLPKDELRKITKTSPYPHSLEYYTTYKFYDALAKQLRGDKSTKQDVNEDRNILQYISPLLPHFRPKSKEDYHDLLEANALKKLVDNHMSLNDTKSLHPEISPMLDILWDHINQHREKHGLSPLKHITNDDFIHPFSDHDLKIT